jgi:general stress protein 26
MGNYKELSGGNAIKQLKEIVDHQRICMMVTATEEQPPHSRPMAVAEVDDAGAFWFLTLRTSEKFQELTHDPRISLYFANPAKQEFLTVHGRTEVSNDRERMKELFNPMAKAWVPDGVDDPDLRLLKVTPVEGYYWDTKDGTVVAGVKILLAMVGKAAGDDGGVEGPLRV